MFRYVGWLILTAALILLSADGVAKVSAETWQLHKGQELKPVSAKGSEGYALAVSEIKQLMNSGRTSDVVKALNKLRKDYPQFIGPDLDAFITAEKYFSQGKYTKAVRSYDKFLDEFPQSELYQAALDREFAIATAYLAGQKRTVLLIFRIRGYEEGAGLWKKSATAQAMPR